MGDVCHEPPILRLGRLQSTDRLCQRRGHAIEPLRPRPELVVGGDRDAGRQIAALDAFGGPARRLDRGEDATRHAPRDEERDEHKEERTHAQGQAQLLKGPFQGGRVANEVEVRPGRSHPTTDDHTGPTAYRRPGVGQSPVGDLRLEIGRQRIDGGLGLTECAVRDRGTPVAQIHDGLDTAGLEGLQEQAVGDVVARGARRQAGTRDEHGQIEAGLVGGRVEGLLVERAIQEQVRADTQQPGGQGHQGDEGDGQAYADAMCGHHRLSARPCSRRPAR